MKVYIIIWVCNEVTCILQYWNVVGLGFFAGFVGLVNQAMTCYLNSLLQTLFMTPEFRNAMYKWVNKFSVFTQAVSFMPWKHNTTQTNIEETAKECLEFTLQTDHIFIGYGYLLADNHCLAFFSSLQPFCFLYKEVKPLFCIEASLYVGKISSTTISGAVACCSLL